MAISPKLIAYLEEDIAGGDITTSVRVPKGKTSAFIIAKEDGVIADMSEAKDIFNYCGADAEIRKPDGSRVAKGDIVMDISGDSHAVLIAERTALNIIGRMSGIATKTARISAKIKKINPRCNVAGTRKTSPGFREYDKKAIALGGGDPHRYNLSDAFLIKDNHLELCTVADAVAKAKAFSVYKKVEIEVENTADALAAAAAGADIIMFDNMTPEMIKSTIAALSEKYLGKGITIEVSGGIREDNVTDYVIAGVDRISMGELTHSVKNFDVSLDVKPAIKTVNLVKTVKI
ncbi:MAG: carboxylating nicotinate-nucleotide diphosphorylase [Methanomicrobium sp.]|nr:carboxylating nicotinate-nucleotide diphosphorylase [Methanomicrobium sp.]